MICLDTNAWIWLITESRPLPRELRRRLERDEVTISAISIWELAAQFEAGEVRLQTNLREFLEQACAAPGLQVTPITPAVAIRAARLGPLFPGDPADRLITATALELGIPLATADEPITRSGVVEVLWD